MSPDRVIPGQVVQTDDDDNDGQDRPQETFLHKVASGPLGPVGATMAGRHARTSATGLRSSRQTRAPRPQSYCLSWAPRSMKQPRCSTA